MALTKVPSNLDATVAITQSASDNSTNVATTAYVTTAVSNLVDGAPAALNTLNEIAAALNDDAALNTTLTNSIATKLPLAGGTMTGDLTTNGDIIIDNSSGDPFLKLKTSAQEYVIRIDQSDSEKFQIRDITNSGTRITLDASGNVGIGTTAPATNLHILESSNSTTPQFRITNDTPESLTMGVVRSAAGTSPNTAFISFDNSLRFIGQTGTTNERMRITEAGNVGIGEDNPISKLHLVSANVGTNGAVAHILQNVATNGPTLLVEQTGGGGNQNVNHGLLIKVDGQNGGLGNALQVLGTNNNLNSGNDIKALTVKNGGNVGIGTDSPSAPLHVTRTASGYPILKLTQNGADQYNTIYVQNSNSTAATVVMGTGGGSVGNVHWANSAVFGTTSDAKVVLLQNDSAAVTIDTDQNVGIGTSLPGRQLHIKGTTTQGGRIKLENTASGFYAGAVLAANAKEYHIGVGGSTTAAGFANNLYFYDGTAGVNRMALDSNGNFGVGTSAPGSRLHVYNNSANNYSTSIRLGQSYNTAYSQISSNFGGSMTINAGQGGGTPTMHLQVNGAEKARLSGTTTGRLLVSGTTRGRIVTQNETSGNGDSNCGAILANDYSSWSTIFSESWLGTGGGWGTFWAGSSGALYRKDSGDTNPNELVFVGSGNKRMTFDLNPGGNAYFDGTLGQSAYDYAEYFEWEDGNPDNEDRRGFTVVLAENGLIRKATSDDDPEEIMGAISGTAAILGDAAIYDWNGKYEIDEWGTRILDDVVTVSWTETDENGEQTNHSYKETEIPAGITVPEDAGRKEHKEYRLTADYDPEQEYVPRERRPEWGIVGLLGKVRIRDESPKNPRWKYIKTIAGKKLWLIR